MPAGALYQAASVGASVALQARDEIIILNLFANEELPAERRHARQGLIDYAPSETVHAVDQEVERDGVAKERLEYSPRFKTGVAIEGLEGGIYQLAERERFFHAMRDVVDGLIRGPIRQPEYRVDDELPRDEIERRLGLARQQRKERVIKELQGVVKRVVLSHPPRLVVRDDRGHPEYAPRQVIEALEEQLLRRPLGPLVVVGESRFIIERGLEYFARPQPRCVDSAEQIEALKPPAPARETEQLLRAFDVHGARGRFVHVEAGGGRRMNDQAHALGVDRTKRLAAREVSRMEGDPALEAREERSEFLSLLPVLPLV